MIQTHISQVREFFPGNLVHWTKEGQTFDFHCDNDVILRLSFLTDSLVRFRFTTLGFFPKDFSYAIDPDFQPRQARVNILETTSEITLETRSLTVKLTREGLKTTLLDAAGNVLLNDDKGFHWQQGRDGNDIVMMSKQSKVEESYFGLGDKTCNLNLRGERTVNWVTDSFAFGTQTKALYRSIPFYTSLVDGLSYGIFFDNPFISYFDFASERSDATSFWTHGGEMNYYFFAGNTPLDIIRQYTQLTGVPEMPPMWSLGFHQSKWSYYPESEVLQLANTFRKHDIPVDALYLDIDYMDGYRCFTWHPERFPNPARLTGALSQMGIKTVVIIDPGIKIDPNYEVFADGLRQDVFCKHMDGPPAKGKVWPGLCYFPDFTSPRVRTWWAGWFRDLVRKDGVAGVWNDMNEPALFEVPSKTFPDDVMHDLEGHRGSHRKAHNLYGMQMSRATQEGLKTQGYPNRPFVITRATYAGGQRYASAWTGDNVASWEHLRLANIQVQRMAASGFSFIGSDIGGFAGKTNGELFVRWLQTGIFHPLCRVHSMGYNLAGDEAVDEKEVDSNKTLHSDLDQEPWSFGEPYTAAAKAAIQFRYRILPLIYSAFWQYINEGTPIIRSLALVHPDDDDALLREEEFYLGDHLLVCPVSTPGAKGRSVYLPEGEWYEFGTGNKVKGGQEVWQNADLHQIPIFVKAGAALPLYPLRPSTATPVTTAPDVRIYPGKKATTSVWYEDSGEGYDYTKGESLLRKIEVSKNGNTLEISQELTGKYTPAYATLILHLYGLATKPEKVMVDGLKTKVAYPAKGHATIEVPWDFFRVSID